MEAMPTEAMPTEAMPTEVTVTVQFVLYIIFAGAWRPATVLADIQISFAGTRRPATGYLPGSRKWVSQAHDDLRRVTFPDQGDGDGPGRHQNAPADGRRHAPVYVTEQLPDGRRRQLEPEVSFSDMRQFSDMHALEWTFDVLRILDQVEELRGCDKRLTAGMLNRLGDLQFWANALPAGFTTRAFDGGALAAAAVP
jgi:hypothetical protein